MKLLSNEQLLNTTPTIQEVDEYVSTFKDVKSDAERIDILSIFYKKNIAQAQLEACEAECKAEREWIIQEIEKTRVDDCKYCKYYKLDCRAYIFREDCLWWQSLKVRIREGV